MHIVFYALAIKGKFAIRICRPFSPTVCLKGKEGWPPSDGVYSYCLLLHADFMRQGAFIMMLGDVSSEALMCPLNVAYAAQLTNCKSAALRATKSKT